MKFFFVARPIRFEFQISSDYYLEYRTAKGLHANLSQPCAQVAQAFPAFVVPAASAELAVLEVLELPAMFWVQPASVASLELAAFAVLAAFVVPAAFAAPAAFVVPAQLQLV